MDALNQLNPQTFSVADVLLLLFVSMVEGCAEKCSRMGKAFHEAGLMINDLQQILAPFFTELQGAEQTTRTTGGTGEVNILQLIKLGIRVEGQRKTDLINRRETLTQLTAVLERQIDVVRAHCLNMSCLWSAKTLIKSRFRSSCYKKPSFSIPVSLETFGCICYSHCLFRSYIRMASNWHLEERIATRFTIFPCVTRSIIPMKPDVML